jgi:hypothetical protein
MNKDYDACRSLYQAARLEERSSPDDRRAVRLALAAAITAGVHVAASAATAATATAALPAAATGAQATAVGVSAAGAKGILQLIVGGKFLSGLVCGAVLGSAVVTTALVVRPSETRPAVRDPVAMQPTKVAKGQVPFRGHGPSVSVDSEANAEPEQPPSTQLADNTPLPHNQSPLVTQKSAALPPTQHQLAEETIALTRIQEALNRQDSRAALVLIDEQKRQFASGQLAEERAAAEVIALCDAGRAAEADAARRRFLTNYPTSPLTKRVNIGCGRP